MKRMLLALVLALGITIGVAAESSAVVTPGTKCTKVGEKQVYKGKTYTCIQRGKNIYWGRGVKVAKPTPNSSVANWQYDNKSSTWVSQGDVPKCPSPLIAEGELLDFSKVLSIVQPGQSRGGSYKPHGGLRWSEYGNYVKGVAITAPFNGEIIGAAQYLVEGNNQFTVNIVNPCGVMLRLGHLLAPSEFMKTVLNTIPPAAENDSRETFLSGIYIKKGQVIATEVGMPPPTSPDSMGTYIDLGIVDLRAKNPILPLTFSSNADNKYSLYSVCWYEGDYLSAGDRTKVQTLPFGDGDSTSDYCKRKS